MLWIVDLCDVYPNPKNFVCNSSYSNWTNDKPQRADKLDAKA